MKVIKLRKSHSFSIFDDAIVFSIKGESFRGRRLETVSLRSSAASPAAAPNQKSGI